MENVFEIQLSPQMIGLCFEGVWVVSKETLCDMNELCRIEMYFYYYSDYFF